MTLRDPEQLLDALDPDQRKVAVQVAGPLAVLAGAGTGKTRAITYRIAYGVATGAFDQTNILAVTFTARAAAEMRSRLRDLGVPGAQARTFHSAALRQLQFFWPGVVGGPVPELIPHKASLVAAAAARIGMRVDKALVRDLAAEIEWSKVSMVGPETYAEQIRRDSRPTPSGTSVEDMVRLLDAYEDAKDERGVIDFEDVLLTLSGMIQERQDVARRIRAQYRTFVVDEYQDVSRLQQHLLDLWLGERHDLCVVGDVAQTIYSFAGASSAYLRDFRKRHRGANVVELTRDYRSTPQVVAVANRLMDHGRASGPVRTSGAVHLTSTRPPGSAVRFSTHADERSEADHVARRAHELHAHGLPWSAIAVLYRTNSQSEVLEQALSEVGVPFVVKGGTRFFDREEVQRAMLALRRHALAHAVVDNAVATTTRDQDAEASTKPQDTLVDLVEEALSVLGWAPQAPVAGGAVRERWDNLTAIVELARAKPDLTLAQFVEELAERSRAQAAPTVEGVTLTTLHTAKGLEWDAVFLVGASEGLLPISMATTPEAREEERRLLYVGITRARDHLEISWAKARGEGGRANRKRSSLLHGIWPEQESSGRGRGRAGEAAPSRKKNRARINEEFEKENSPQVVALFERMRQWRLDLSRQLGVPPFAVLTDQTLRDVAVAGPRTLTQLRVIKGIGEVKLDRFGAPLLALIRGEEPASPADEDG
ncbi:ATP-dependent DNA helicase UvrD2 [Schaalia sp. 19OD2882]|uniref:ATP-dependent DNA helicase UvrD2 n=1 Tax=Schaalia sp. 19OD2882 TaxID=2794089 RepID=UPI001C1F0B42|nr:ATP-dependent DNA helicase UvrD2 [Schaalia sp. 19OD2882]QWW20185.1 ATP-dependent DNA helicase UvrD2 [Schaalia sp. 19OD2882]